MKGSRILLNLLIKTFGLTDELVIGFDGTVERRRGKQIKAKGIYRDAVRSSKSFACQNQRLAVALLYVVDGSSVCQQSVGIYDEERGIRHRKLHEPRPTSDFVDKTVAARVGISVSRR